MALKINLLAEYQAAEEARRKDPVKRAIIVGIGLLVLTILWIIWNQFNIGAARRQIVVIEDRFKAVDTASRTVKDNQAALNGIRQEIKSLDKYSTNRFFWGTFMDALQGIVVNNIRLVDIRAQQQYVLGATNLLYTTNVFVPYTPGPPFWKFWADPPPMPDTSVILSNYFKLITNRPVFLTNVLPYVPRAAINSTNVIGKTVNVQIDFVTPTYMSEQVSLTIKGRDYSPNGSLIDTFTHSLATSPYFLHRLAAGRDPHVDRPTQAIPDPNDLDNPTGLFIPFTIECRFEPRILTNE